MSANKKKEKVSHMNEHLHQIWGDVRDVLGYPLIPLGNGDFTLGGLLGLLGLMALVLFLERFVRRLVLRRLLQRTHLEASVQYAVSRFIGYCFIAIGFFIALRAVNVDLSSLAVIAGAIGIGVGFGLQNVISNFVSGLIILAERPIAIGHRVEVGGVAGQITKINLRSTTVVTNDNITIIVPNSEFISNAVTNWSHGDPKVRLRLPVGVAYGSDIPKLKRVLLEVAAQHRSVLKDPPPSLFFIGFGESSLDFELGVWTVDQAHNPIRFRSELYYAIEQALRDNQLEIPFPQRDLHFRSGKVTIDGGKGEAGLPPK